jgi:hypothetical protein
MSARGLQPQTVVIPFGQGINQKMDPRALEVGSLAVCLDAAFTEIGGLQTRYPYASIGANIFGGGTVSDCRRIVENGDELLLFTKTALYSWNAGRSAWVLKSTYLAAKIDEVPRFVTTDDQISCDRAELSGTVVYTWTNGDGTLGYVAAIDKTTGSVLMAPTLLTSEGRPRVVALTTKILLFSVKFSTTELQVRAIDPAAPATGVAGAATTITALIQSYYDVCKVPGADQAAFACRYNPTTSYLVGTATAALVVASSVKARTCDGPIAVSCPSTGTHIQVIRANSTNIQGDLIAVSGLSDVYTAQAVGTGSGTINQIAAAHRSVQDSSAYRCYAFWSSSEASGATDWSTKYNWVDTSGALGTQGTFLRRLGVASRAFDHEGSVYVWLAFAGESSFSGANASSFRAQLQNSYFLYRDDVTLHAKSAFQRAGGFSAQVGHLGGVANIGGSAYAWCGVERRIIDLGGSQSGYGARAPRDVTVTFDSNAARRCARLGQTLYIASGEGVMQYDGAGVYEVGCHIYPWYFGAVEVASGNLADGIYAIKNTLRWDNAKGEIDRSTTATTGTVTIAAGPNGISIVSWIPLYVTHKTGIAVEVWRSAVNPLSDSPFYLVTSKDPAAASNPNRYIANDTTASLLATFNDEFADSTATTKESSAENGDLLEYLAPPAAAIIHATADRLFLAGVAGDPHRVLYSRQRQEGEVASFHDALAVDVPRAGGDITAIAVRDGVLYVWRESACYALPGDGFDNLGQGQNFGPARLISSDVGCVSMEALAQTSTGYIFKSSKGWYALEGASVQYIGDKVSDYDSDTVYAVHVLEGQHQIRVLTSARMLVYDTNVQQWAEWTVADGLHAALWNGTYHYLATAAVKAEQSTYTSLTYGMDVETAWIPLGNIQGFGRLWEVNILGEYRSEHYVRVRLYKNFNSATAFQDKSWLPSPTTVGGPEQVKHRPSIQEMQAVKIRISASTAAGGVSAPPGEALKLSHLTLELGLERHLARLPSAQAQ